MNIQNKKRGRTTRFLIGSFILLLLVSLGAFGCFGLYMVKVSRNAVDKVGDLYMSGINNHITAHFRTLIDLKLEQAEAVVRVVPEDMDDIQDLYDELVYRISVRNFNYLALYSDDGSMQMLDGEQIRLADPGSFYESLLKGEKKVAVGNDKSGNQIVMFGIAADYPMSKGRTCLALVAAVPIEYISTMLGTEQSDALIYSHIIREDGSFVVSEMSDEYSNYFSSLYQRYPDDDPAKIDRYVRELSSAMENKENFSVNLGFNGSRQQVYCTMMPYSEWHLLTTMPFGILNETVQGMNRKQTIAGILVCIVILFVLLIIFYTYFKMTCQQMRELDEARKEALQATEAKSSFLSNMSHDIRTPMNAIVGMTAIATAHIDDKEHVRSCLKKISSSGRHLLGLINDVLDMSKIESGKMTLTVERVSLREVLEGIAGIVQTQVKGKGQNLKLQVDNIIAEEVYCDSVRLNQVLLNLLSNAVKYTQEGGTIQFSLYQEAPAGERERKTVRTHMIVKDNGQGMTAEFLEHIFDSYARADTRRVRKTEGAGLGMAITKYIVDAMEGTITVTSEPDKGSEFHVTLDLEIAEERDYEMVFPDWKILVVDDDEELCHSAAEALESIGLRADWTLSGTQAVNLVVKHHQEGDDYQIILLDWKLPDIDGLYVAKQIRRKIGDKMPIILISAYDWSEFEADAKAAGISGFIAKPLFKSTLYHGIKKYMDDGETQNEAATDTGLSGRRVLVAEDNEINWEILKELLGDVGLELDWAENGKICLEKFQQSGQGYFDAILMDIRMPVMDGYESTRAIRSLGRPDAQLIPVIAMTADAFSEDIRQCLDSGMNAHTAKPINLDEVLSLLKKYILKQA